MHRKVSEILHKDSHIQIVASFALSEKEVAMNALIAKLRFKDRLNLISDKSMIPVLSITPSGFRPSTGFVAMNLAMQSNTEAVNMY